MPYKHSSVIPSDGIFAINGEERSSVCVDLFCTAVRWKVAREAHAHKDATHSFEHVDAHDDPSKEI